MIALGALNTMPAGDFAAALGAIFEHSPWVAQRAAAARPYESRLQLLEAMRGIVDAAAPEEQLALIRAHPQLGARGRSAAALTAASVTEQRRAGLDACTGQQWARLDELNVLYVAKFAMPFILAVRGHDPESIIENMQSRLSNELPIERRTALREIGLIAGYRLAAAVTAPAGAEILTMRGLLALDASAAFARLREWMQAAELDITVQAGGALLGRRRSAKLQAKTLVIGVHYESQTRALRYEGQIGLLSAIALVQQLQEKGVRLPFDLCLLTPPSPPREWEGASPAQSDAPGGCVTLADAAAAVGDGERALCLGALRAAGVGDTSLVIARNGPTGISYRAAAVDAPMLERAVGALVEFLVQNRQALNHNGSVAHG
jgi:OHCU decarboxylase